MVVVVSREHAQVACLLAIVVAVEKVPCYTCHIHVLHNGHVYFCGANSIRLEDRECNTTLTEANRGKA